MNQIKNIIDGRVLLNVACSFRTHPAWNNVDFSAYARLAHHKGFAGFLNKCGLLSDARYDRVLTTDSDIILHDLRKGIPYSDETFDCVYHSHFLEHLEKPAALKFLEECRRVLKSNGILRVVVPDLETQISNYVAEILKLAENEAKDLMGHQKAVHKLFDQMILAEPGGTREQNRFVRYIEYFLRGNSAKAGELHRWMYDRYSLKELLMNAGFCNIKRETAESSSVAGWEEFMMDTKADGTPIHSDSLYMEGIKR
jgi:SAM-dependent methyltransferase